MVGFELCYESDKGESVLRNNPYYKNITNNLKIEKDQLRQEIKNKYNTNNEK